MVHKLYLDDKKKVNKPNIMLKLRVNYKDINISVRQLLM